MANKITPFLWFDSQAEEAAKFYVSIFKNSKLGLSFTLDGQEFRALNGGPQFKFSPAISLFVDCKTQKEVDELWEKLSAGGQKQPCGWLQDKYGVSWQIIPTVLGKLLADKDRRKAQKVMQAMLQMQKLDIKGLEAAYG
jgi:predicted 3-demethylubiquinone-9 3-methyltransferase (glyoxalase superfamily)